MDNRNLRIGDYVKDPNNYGYICRVGIDELRYSEIFQPAPLYEEFFTKNGINAEEVAGETAYFLEKGPIIINARKQGEVWLVSVRNMHEKRKFEGEIRYLHEFQHVLDDCLIHIRLLS